MGLLVELLQVRALPPRVILHKASQAPLALQEVRPVEGSSLVSSSTSSRVQARRDSLHSRDNNNNQASTPDSLADSTKPAFTASRASNPRTQVSSLSREASLGSRVSSQVDTQGSRHNLEACRGSRGSSHSMDNLGQVQASTHHSKAVLVRMELVLHPQVQAMVLALLGHRDYSRRSR